MEPRIAYPKVAPGGFKALGSLEAYLAQSGLEIKLLHLIKLRCSQINGCAFCIDMHWKDLRALGESEQRLYGLDAWREAPYYTPRERAVLGWVEALTKITEGHAPDAAYEGLRAQCSEREAVDVTYAAAAINAWNRIAIGMRSVPGEYQSARHAEKPTP